MRFGYLVLSMLGFSVALSIVGCSSKPQVYYAKQLEMDATPRKNEGESIDNIKREVFIIQNAPVERKLLFSIINRNESLAPIDRKQVEDRYTSFDRYYYRSSRDTPVDFTESSSGWSPDYIWEHTSDLICGISMIRRDWLGSSDSLRITWTSNCTLLGDTLIESHK